MERGSVYWVNLEPSNPPELGKVRPAIVVSNATHNLALPSVVVIPLSSKKPQIWPLRVSVRLSNLKESFAIIPGIRQVSKIRLQNLIGYLSKGDLKAVDDALQTYLRD
ncbi:MAG: type II toxin-antitoxin system PemK/MazF family toxin [Deltaproteobacteria bacterium]|nr:type II toxin-antitoxin system PemK/MazF family toxin [Deltaproteobacteria bacterium]